MDVWVCFDCPFSVPRLSSWFVCSPTHPFFSWKSTARFSHSSAWEAFSEMPSIQPPILQHFSNCTEQCEPERKDNLISVLKQQGETSLRQIPGVNIEHNSQSPQTGVHLQDEGGSPSFLTFFGCPVCLVTSPRPEIHAFTHFPE